MKSWITLLAISTAVVTASSPALSEIFTVSCYNNNKFVEYVGTLNGNWDGHKYAVSLDDYTRVSLDCLERVKTDPLTKLGEISVWATSSYTGYLTYPINFEQDTEALSLGETAEGFEVITFYERKSVNDLNASAEQSYRLSLKGKNPEYLNGQFAKDYPRQDTRIIGASGKLLVKNEEIPDEDSKSAEEAFQILAEQIELVSKTNRLELSDSQIKYRAGLALFTRAQQFEIPCYTLVAQEVLQTGMNLGKTFNPKNQRGSHILIVDQKTNTITFHTTMPYSLQSIDLEMTLDAYVYRTERVTTMDLITGRFSEEIIMVTKS